MWNVFDYDAQSDKFQVVNTMYYSSDPGSLDIQRNLMQVKDGESVAEQEALTAISRCEDKIPEEDETPAPTTQPEEDGKKLITDPAEAD